MQTVAKLCWIKHFLTQAHFFNCILVALDCILTAVNK